MAESMEIQSDVALSDECGSLSDEESNGGPVVVIGILKFQDGPNNQCTWQIVLLLMSNVKIVAALFKFSSIGYFAPRRIQNIFKFSKGALDKKSLPEQTIMLLLCHLHIIPK